ncbi:MAG TPA: hypothetical protein VFK35_05390 [Candidatus Limnocylindrales bacterium]|nr:hypothetical protein [Candidatus Limnocylindrales bacterium]
MIVRVALWVVAAVLLLGGVIAMLAAPAAGLAGPTGTALFSAAGVALTVLSLVVAALAARPRRRPGP